MASPRPASSGTGEAVRRSTACTQCQKHKVRCVLERGKLPCKRCKFRNLTCKYEKHASSSSEGNELNQAIIQDMRMLHTAVNDLRLKCSFAPLPALQSVGSSSQGLQSPGTVIPDEPAESQPQIPPEIPENQDTDAERLVEASRRASTADELSEAPMRSLYQITGLRSLRSQRLPGPSAQVAKGSSISKDLISRGLLNWSDADRLVKAYLQKSDYYLYGITSKYKDVDSIRRSSTLLLVAICTVSAAQESTGAKIYRTCHAELRKLVSDFVFSPHVDLEDFRGLCISCFWLSDISWSVSGLAIRRAIEFELQKSFDGIVAQRSSDGGNRTSSDDLPHVEVAIERMRLWYLFYVCDQHLSILYGRQPVIHHQPTITEWEVYLSTVPDSIPDLRIMSQVALLQILNSVSELFGQDVNSRIPVVLKTHLSKFNNQLDHWVVFWSDRYKKHPEMGDYPIKAISLHFYFAKLFVCSHVFRGLSSDAAVDPVSPEFLDLAQLAIESAKCIIHLTVEDSILVAAFAGVPHYFHTMIAFACSFLLKTATKFRWHVDIDSEQVFKMIEPVVALCKSTLCTEYHLVRWIGEGLSILLSACQKNPKYSSYDWNQTQLPFPATNQDFLATPMMTGNDVSADYSMDRQNIDSIWTSAYQAAMRDSLSYGFPYNYNTTGSIDTAVSPQTYAGNTMFSTAAPSSSLNYANMEHFGLGFGLL